MAKDSLRVEEGDALEAVKPREVLEIDGAVIRRQPPIVGDYCSVPRSGRARWNCGYYAITCEGTGRRCPRCHFSYCEKHFSTHIREILAPPDTWNEFMRYLNDRMRAVAAGNRNAPIRAPKPPITEEEPEEPDADPIPA